MKERRGIVGEEKKGGKFLEAINEKIEVLRNRN
jgi:hypothetical protein